jgi:transcriptional regulator with XRE-family HTH domain
LCRIRFISQVRYTTRSKIGSALRALRESKGLSQDGVARSARIGRSTLVHLEAGADVRLSRAAAVARILGAEIGVLAEHPDLAARRSARAEQAGRMLERRARHIRLAAMLLANQPAACDALREARAMVALWERGKVCSAWYIDTWKVLLAGTPRKVGAALANLDEKWASALVQNTPFAFAPESAAPQ